MAACVEAHYSTQCSSVKGRLRLAYEQTPPVYLASSFAEQLTHRNGLDMAGFIKSS